MNQCYAPTEEADTQTKDEFYEMLESTLSSCHKSDMKIVLGDFNAKVGADNSNLTHVMGKFGLPSNITDNGNRLIEMCSANQLYIGGTRFPHKKIHQYTWQSPDGRRNQIDYILISQKNSAHYWMFARNEVLMCTAIINFSLEPSGFVLWLLIKGQERAKSLMLED